jgi:hypothetical protein
MFRSQRTTGGIDGLKLRFLASTSIIVSSRGDLMAWYTCGLRLSVVTELIVSSHLGREDPGVVSSASNSGMTRAVPGSTVGAF